MSDGRVRFRVDSSGQWSGGGSVFVDNARFAAARHPELFGGAGAVPIVPRNVPVGRRPDGPFLLAPQNAWPWQPRALGARERARVAALRAAGEWYLRRAAGVLRISSAIPAVRPQWTSPVLHNVLDRRFDAMFDGAGRAPDGADGAIVSIGSAYSYRGFETLVAAHSAYRRAGGRLPLFIAGPPANQRYVRRVEALADGEVTFCWGSLERSECVAAYRRAACVVLPSRVEASPLTLLEALACTPHVVCSRIAGHVEIVRAPLGPDGLFPAGDAATLAQRLGTVESPAHERAHRQWSDAAFREEQRERWADALAAWLRVTATRIAEVGLERAR